MMEECKQKTAWMKAKTRDRGQKGMCTTSTKERVEETIKQGNNRNTTNKTIQGRWQNWRGRGKSEVMREILGA